MIYIQFFLITLASLLAPLVNVSFATSIIVVNSPNSPGGGPPPREDKPGPPRSAPDTSGPRVPSSGPSRGVPVDQDRIDRIVREYAIDQTISYATDSIAKVGNFKIGGKSLRKIFDENRENCFSGDTKVLTEGKSSSLEYKEIKDITLEDKVWTCSYSDQSCMLRHPKKLGKRYTEDGELVLLVLENDEGVSTEIEVTNEHPFNTGERSWTQVADLKEGDTLWDIEGKQHTVISKTPMEGVFEVYNLEIGSGDYDDDNYYVSEMGILSHNCSMVGTSLIAASLFALPGGQIVAFTALLSTGMSFRAVAQMPKFEYAVEKVLVDAAINMTGVFALKFAGRIANMAPVQKLFEAAKHGMLKPVKKTLSKIANSAKKLGMSHEEQVKDFAKWSNKVGGVEKAVRRVQKSENLVKSSPKGAFLNRNVYSGSFPNKTQSLAYHHAKHGKGRTPSKYIEDAQSFFNKNKGQAKPHMLLDGTSGLSIKTKYIGPNGKTVRQGGFFKKDGRVVTYWD